MLCTTFMKSIKMTAQVTLLYLKISPPPPPPPKKKKKKKKKNTKKKPTTPPPPKKKKKKKKHNQDFENYLQQNDRLPITY